LLVSFDVRRQQNVKSEKIIGNQTINTLNLKSDGDVETTMMSDEVTAIMLIAQQLSHFREDACHRS
jgi:hypothetical protein